MGFAKDVMDVLNEAVQKEGNAKNLAQAVGLNAPTLTRWLTGVRDPTLANLALVMDYLGVTLSTSPSSAGATTCPELEAEVARLRAENKRLELELTRELSRRDGQIDLLKEQLAEAQAGRQAETEPAERKAAG